MLKKILLQCILCICTYAAFSQAAGVTAADSIAARAEQIERSGNTISKLGGDKPVKQPVGIKAPGCPYSIVIDRIEITEKGGFMDVSAAIPIPGSDKPICFRAKRVAFSAGGGFSGSARMELVSEVRTSLVGGMDIVIPKDGKTFVEFDCDGFKQMGLSADLLFRSDLIVPVSDPKSKDNNVVKAHLETVVKDANDIMASISMSPFMVKGLDGFTFTVKDASLDQSDFSNPAGFSIPNGYNNILYATQPTLWRGVFLKSVSVTLPSYLNGSSREPLTVSGENLLFDDSGITGKFSATSVLPLEKGAIPGGFAMSIGNAAIELVQNELTSGSLAGAIRLPISSKDTLGYTASADATGRFVFTATPSDTIKFDVWKAKAKIDPSSLITIATDEGGIVVKTLLNGSLAISAPVVEGSKKTLDMTVPFEELYLSNRAPYFEVKAFGLNNLNAKQNFAGFSYSIDSIGFSCKGSKASLNVGLKLAIGGSGSNSFSAAGRVELKAARENTEWKFKGMDIDKFSLCTEFSGFKLSGSLALFNDSKQYGDGIGGNIKMELKPLKFEVGAAAIFGSVDGYKYWYADAFTTTKIQVGTGLMLTSLGGGAYAKMRQGMPANAEEDYGKGSSGISYIPDRNMNFGFMAKVGLASTDGKIVNGDAALEMAFNSHGGISYISFLGHAEIMAAGKMAKMADAIKKEAGKLAEVVDKVNKSVGSINDKLGKEVVLKSDNAVDLKGKAEKIAQSLQANSDKAPITATLYSIFDFDNGSFFAKLEATVNAAGVLKGIGEGGKAGEMVMYFGRDKWYVHCGTPSAPIGLELLGMARTKSYFMMGHDMPAFPAPPQKVLDIIGLEKVDRSRDISSLEGGTGIAFGSSFDMDTGNLQFLMFYARFAAGLGFDVMLKNYGNTSCAGEDGRLGINGWYAMGQAWAYVQGEVGIKVKMMFVRGNFPIFKIGVGTLLEAQLPNPCWFHGAVGGSYNILGGLVKGRCKFEFELGKKCKIKSNAKDLLANMNIISDIRPSDGSSDVSVFSKPQAVLNMPVEKSFEIDAPDGEKYKFRAKLDKLVALSDGVPVVGVLQLNDDSTVVTVKPHCILPEKKNLTISCELSFEEYKKGAWVKVMDEGRPVTEAKAVTFTTGAAPNFIPEDNVAIEYPVRGQQAFYKDEYGKGFVVLDAWQDNLFSNPKFRPFAQFKVGNQVVGKTAITTSYDKKQISFDIPQSLLATSTSYKLVLVNEPTDRSTSIDKNVEKKETAVKETEGDVGDMSITTREAKEDLVMAEDKELYSVPFKTSMFKTFGEKFNVLSVDVLSYGITETVSEPLLGYRTVEPFDIIEKKGIHQTNSNPLIQITTSLENNNWYKEIESLIYKEYPFLGIGKVNRQINTLGIPPYNAISFYVNSQEILYNIPLIISQDYHQISNEVASLFVNREKRLSEDNCRKLEKLLWNSVGTFKTRKDEVVPLEIKYVLPNGVTTSKISWSFKYFINE